MKKITVLLSATLLVACSEPKPMYLTVDEYPAPQAEICEMQYSPNQTQFQVWAPAADAVTLRLYAQGEGGEPEKAVQMSRCKEGLWSAQVKGDLLGRFYTFAIVQDSVAYDETPGIFAKAVGVNGQRGAIIRLADTDPEGWADDQRPALASTADAVIYEMHWRDISIADNSGIANKGKYLSLTEEAGIGRLKKLGVTHIHILPSYDYSTVDETRLDEPQYNWGYDPLNYNVPEGSYSTDPFNPLTRIREFKQMVMACHKAGIRVVLDVVYNHTVNVEGSNFHRTAPGYFHRKDSLGQWGNASGCSNETASERPMMRKFMLESVAYWMNEYHIDGFRFDLMGIHDIETMNQIAATTRAIDPQVLIYGEGWACNTPVLADSLCAMKAHAAQLDGIAVFSDELRDALRGPFWSDTQGAFLVGEAGHENDIRFGIEGGINGWAAQPQQLISYVSCHDDMCLVDRLRATKPGIKRAELIALHQLAQTAVFTSQGIPFIYAGEEVLRDKKGVHNTYNSPDSVNAIDWSRQEDYAPTLQYYSNLIAMRRHHKAFHMGDAELVRQHLHFLDSPSLTVAYQIDGTAVGDTWQQIIVVLNANKTAQTISIPAGTYTIAAKQGVLNEEGLGTIKGNTLRVAPQSAMIIFK